MNPQTKNFTLLSLSLILTLYLANPAFAASGGRISSGGFSRSSGSSSSYSYSRPSSPSRSSSYGSGSRSSYSYSSPSRSSGSYNSSPSRSRVEEPDDDFFSVPDISIPVPLPAPRPRVIYVPTPAPTPVVVPAPVTPSTPVVAPVLPSSQKAEVQVSQSPQPLQVLPLILILGVGGLVFFLLLSSGRQSNPNRDAPSLSPPKPKPTLAHVQVALLASAKDLQEDLEKLAEFGDTDTEKGLTKILQETVLALLRHPEKVVYAYGEFHREVLSRLEPRYNQISMEERSAISEEVLSNVSGKVTHSSHQVKGGGTQGEGEYIYVGLLVATNKEIYTGPVTSMGQLRESLISLGAISPENLLALEIIWQPEGEKETLSQEELLASYPNLNHL